MTRKKQPPTAPPRQSWDDEALIIPNLQVDSSPQDTGLLDANGYKLVRHPDRIGFVRGKQS